MIRVLLADDQPLIRNGLQVLIDSEPDLEVVGEVGDGLAAVELARATRPDVVLMDIRMPGVDGLEATRRIAADPDLEDTRVLVLTTFEVEEHVFEALRSGASGFLGKTVERGELLSGIRVVHRGEALLSPGATTSLVARFLAQPEPGPVRSPELLAPLTQREREVVRDVASGLTNDEIARRLVLSPATVKTHVNRAMTKLGVRDRAQLVVLAYQCGLVGERPDAGPPEDSSGPATSRSES